MLGAGKTNSATRIKKNPYDGTDLRICLVSLGFAYFYLLLRHFVGIKQVDSIIFLFLFCTDATQRDSSSVAALYACQKKNQDSIKFL